MRGSTHSDSELWRHARAGDPAARQSLTELARMIAAAELRRRGVHRDALDDLVQESVGSTLAFLGRDLPEPRDLRAFLKFRSWGVLSDHRKRMRSTSATTDIAGAHDVAAADSSPSVRLHARELARALADCKQRLGADHREVVELRYGARLETDAIAERLAVHRNTVSVRVFRALEKLRECLGRKGFDASDLTARTLDP